MNEQISQPPSRTRPIATAWRSRTSWRSLLVVLMALGLVAAACGDDDTAGEPGDVSTSASPDDTQVDGPSEDLTASWVGVTEDTIKLGFTTSDLEELKKLGLVDLDRGDPQVALDALVNELNERGGINGRMVEANLEVVLPIGATAAQEACVRLTEDIEVFAVLAPFVGPNAEVNPCLNDEHATVIVGGQPTTEQLEASKAPWISNTMFSNRRLGAVVDLMEEEDLLGDTVGLVVTAEERPAADDIVIPALEELGKTVIDAEVISATIDPVATTEAFETIIERFIAEDVDSVVMVENTATFGASLFADSDLDAELLVVDSAQLVAGLGARGEIDPELLAGIIGSGGASAEESWELDSTQECVSIFEEANPDIDVVPTAEVADGDSDWFTNIMIFCAPLRLFEMAATAAGTELTPDTFLEGAESLGEIELPGLTVASIGPDKYDAMDAIRLTVFDPSIPPEGNAAPYGPLVEID